MSLEDGNPDEHIVTALQIFQDCGADAGSTLRVDALMEQFAPFMKTNNTEYSYLKSLLDPEQSDPAITVPMLAASLTKYSESQKVKFDLEESFNKSGHVPHDSDSGISTDGFQLLEELQSELREKSHLAQQLRTQLDYSDRHHEEALAAVTAERDSLKIHLNMLRDENMTLTHVRRDYEEVCERLTSSEKALNEVRKELEGARRRAKVLTEQVTLLENEKLNLQDLLAKSKDDCHRINEMYASRQSFLLEQNETLRTEHADLSSRMRDQEEFMQQIIKEKVLLEMEVKDMLNKSNQFHQHMERSIDVSYTEDQMLTALDSLNADSRFRQDSRLLDEDSFVNALKEDHGRPTNMSLFDEIRLSFCNMSRHNTTDMNTTEPIEKPLLYDSITASTQTDDKLYYVNKNEMFKPCDCKVIESNTFAVDIETQTDKCDIKDDGHSILDVEINQHSIRAKENLILDAEVNRNNVKDKHDLMLAAKTNKVKENIILFDSKMTKRGFNTQNPQKIEKIREKEKRYNLFMKNRMQSRSLSDPNVGKLKNEPNYLLFKDETENLKIDTKDQATMTCLDVFEVFKDTEVMNIGTQTDAKDIEHIANNNNIQVCIDCTKCIECDRLKNYTTKLENDIKLSNLTITEMKGKLDEYEKSLEDLARFVDEGNKMNSFLKNVADSTKCVECDRFKRYTTKLENDINLTNVTITEMKGKFDEYEKNLEDLTRFVDAGNKTNSFLRDVVDSSRNKLAILEHTCTSQGNKIDRLFCETCSTGMQTESEQATVSTQVETPCEGCVKRNASRRSIRSYLWEPLKSLFQLFALLCFLLALWVLYGVTRRWRACREPLPWSWLQPADLLDLFLTIEYVSEVPM